MPFTHKLEKIEFKCILLEGCKGLNMTDFLNQRQIALLKKSFRQLDTDKFASRFYARLFESHPEIKPLFTQEMSEQKTKLMSVFELVIFSFDEKKHDQFALEDSLLLPLRHLGILHEEKSIRPHHYDIANNLLLETLEYCMGPQFNQDIKDAWSLALQHLTQAMLNEDIKVGKAAKKDSTFYLRETFRDIIQKLKR